MSEKIIAGVYYATYGHWTQSLINAGYEVAWHFQPDIKDPRFSDRTARMILTTNFPDIPYVSVSKLGANLICGSPPCIGFSAANPNSGPDHWANKNFINCFKTINHIKPDFFLVEMVPNIFTKGAKTLEAARREMDDYEVYSRTMNVANFGSPCLRMRVYFIGKIKSGIAWSWNPLDELPKKDPFPCSNILDQTQFRGFDNYRPDERLLSSMLNKTGKMRKGPYSLLVGEKIKNRILKPDGYVPTITGTCHRDTIHYRTKRFLAIPEIQALMGFEPDYRFQIGSVRNASQACKMIASGVDIRFTTYLLKFLKEEHWFEE